MQHLATLQASVIELLGDDLIASDIRLDELTCEVKSESIQQVCEKLRDHSSTAFDQLIDLCGVDYTTYGAEGENSTSCWTQQPFAVVYHLQSVEHNHRIRLRAGLAEASLEIDSVINVWPVAEWFEREAFDLFGIIFNGHPDLRRLLTDYGFIGHPFRKDFPLSGEVEVRYDEQQGRVIYQPVTVDDRILVPRVIREDGFLADTDTETQS